MRELAIKRELNEETREQEIWCMEGGKVKLYTLHITNSDEVIITDTRDYSKIYSIQSLDYYRAMEQDDSSTIMTGIRQLAQEYAVAYAILKEAMARNSVEGPNGKRVLAVSPTAEYNRCSHAKAELLQAVLNAMGFIETENAS